MTTATLSFDPRTVPATGSEMNRYPHGRTPGGHLAAPDEAYAGIVQNLVLDLQRAAEQLIPESKEVKLRKCVRDDATGTYKLVARPSVSAVPTHAAVARGKFSRLEHHGVELLNDALTGGESFAAATDDQLWAALVAAAEDVQAKGRPLRVLCDNVALLILLRAGIVADAHQLPWE